MNQTPQEFMNAMNILFPHVENFLHAVSDFQFLIAIILSAQMTDIGVNKATNSVFQQCFTPQDFLDFGEKKLLESFKSINFYPTKTKNVLLTAQKIIDDFNGEIPNSRKDLITLPGVGNKTAGVFLVQKEYDFAFPVDTHIARVAKCFGFSCAKKPDGIEADLQNIFPKLSWNLLHKQMILYGRQYLPARKKNISPSEAWDELEKILSSL